MTKTIPIRRPNPSEEGYMLVAVIFMVALLTIALAVALPKISKQIQRDRELETMHRGKQYIRGIKLYYKKFGAYPPNVDALIKTNNIRFLRKKYKDPTTGKEDWKPVLFGQNKAPTAMGFFGQPLGGASVAGIGPSGGNGLQGGSSLSGANGLNNQQATSTDPNAPSTDPNNPNGANGAAGTSGSSFGSQGGSTNGMNGQTFGGAGIIGFSPNSPKQSIMVYKKKNHYNEWEFVYDPLAEQMMMSGGNTGTIGQPAGSTTNPFGSTTPNANNPPANPPTTPTAPQQ
ncbi:MAG: type II secretion system protein [Terracidiphilus sp.]|jgi:type II secretory pathway pseudopilin PulG